MTAREKMERRFKKVLEEMRGAEGDVGLVSVNLTTEKGEQEERNLDGEVALVITIKDVDGEKKRTQKQLIGGMDIIAAVALMEALEDVRDKVLDSLSESAVAHILGGSDE